jgi:predicted cobalt transporter CbtA
MKVELEQSEWQNVINVLVKAEGAGINWLVTNPLIVKINEQCTKEASHASQERLKPGNGEQQHPRDDQGWTPETASGGGGAAHRAQKPAR